jgi:hypothetical protein
LSFYGIDDPNIETAISIKNSLHNVMRMTKASKEQWVFGLADTSSKPAIIYMETVISL